jgi:hypothetical protein
VPVARHAWKKHHRIHSQDALQRLSLTYGQNRAAPRRPAKIRVHSQCGTQWPCILHHKHVFTASAAPKGPTFCIIFICKANAAPTVQHHTTCKNLHQQRNAGHCGTQPPVLIRALPLKSLHAQRSNGQCGTQPQLQIHSISAMRNTHASPVRHPIRCANQGIGAGRGTHPNPMRHPTAWLIMALAPIAAPDPLWRLKNL